MTFAAFISEAMGAFVFIFLFMMATDKKTQFSNDKVINCFILASSYIAARLLCGGELVTCFTRLGVSDYDIDNGTAAEDVANMEGKTIG